MVIIQPGSHMVRQSAESPGQPSFLRVPLLDLQAQYRSIGQEVLALVDEIGGETGLTGDVEGVSIYRGAGADEGWIVVSSQGSSTFHLYERAAPNAFAGRFAARLGEDMITGTDGVAVSAASLGPDLPDGLLVVQDDVNSAPDAPQNFKYLDWRAVLEAARTPDAAGE